MRRDLDFWSPFSFTRDIDAWQRNINQLFANTLSGNLPRAVDAPFAPACDIEESDSDYKMTFDVPGLNRDDIKISVSENTVSVSGERTEERKDEGKNKRLYERTYGKFERSFQLPIHIDADKVEAHYDKGVLYLIMPKAEANKTKQITIKEGLSQAISDAWNKGFKKDVKITKEAPRQAM